MRPAGAFFANRAEIVDYMLNVDGDFWASTSVPAGAAGFQCCCVVLCGTRRRDVGTQYTLHIDAASPTGQRWAPAWSTKFQLPSAMKLMVLTQMASTIEPNRRARLQLRARGKPRAVRRPIGCRRRLKVVGEPSSPRPGKRSLTTRHPLGFAKANRA
jgi:hypothetical protein